MDYSDEIDKDFNDNTSELDPMTIEIIKLSERAKIFAKLRRLIQEKQDNGDSFAEGVLGWAYEQLAD